MFYIDDLLKDNNNCYILKIGDKVLGRAPIKEDFVLNTTYSWKDQDNRSIVDLFMDALKQGFKNARQLQGHMQAIVAAAKNDKELRAAAYRNIAQGKTPMDTSYMTVPVLTHTQSSYNLPPMTFIFVNKDDTIAYIEDAEDFLWQVSGINTGTRTDIVEKEDGSVQEVEYTSYHTPTPGNKPGFSWRENRLQKKNKSAKGFTIVKGNLVIENLSLENMQISFSKELNLKGYPQAIKVTLTYKDTKRRYPAEAVNLLRMARQDNNLLGRGTNEKVLRTLVEAKKPKQKKK